MLIENQNQPMHVGGLLIFSPPDGTTADEYLTLIEGSLTRESASPLLSRTAVRRAGGLYWAWQQHADADLQAHVSRHQLTAGATEADLFALCEDLHSRQLDHSRPLWEMHTIAGLPGDRFALYAKIHHSLADGVAAISMLRARLSGDQDTRDMPAPWSDSEDTVPHATDDAVSRDVRSLRHVATNVVSLAGVVPAVAGAVLRAFSSRGGPLSLSAPRTVLNQEISSARAFAAGSWSLDRLRLIAKVADCSVNDIVLAVCGGALRAFLAGMDELPERSLIAMVPVSLRTTTEGVVSGNKIGLLTCELGTDLPHAGDRLTHINKRMREGKEFVLAHDALQNGVTSALGVASLAPGVLFGLHVNMPPPFNVVISNLAGPREPRYWNGALLEELHPLSVPISGVAVNITCTSNHDRIAFGITTAREVVRAPDEIVERIGAALTELEVSVGLREQP